ncbi:PPE domain-containing protein [Nocardia sp. NBC_00508]|uniref:PPE domain-containing protein n=1 Tax=Nocardia sp. NBC_00508 TaxID=2975992 RepID=UPI002E81CF02|nr:PPE domain-containing protein [Nocardia sp. NBC_00508]WUD68144.1 PPE domain-containing protein [Nocardia sp. NBC_00508]
MPLNVDPQELVATAAKLAAMARDTGAALPPGWVVPAGADPISAQAVPQLNAQAASLLNGMIGVLNEIQRTAYNVGAAAVDYTEEDDRGAQTIGGSGRDIVANPVGEVQEVSQRRPPSIRFPVAGGAVDPLTFAKQLHTGPGPGAAKGFADALRSFTGGPHLLATEGVDSAARVMQNWEPVGAAAATELGQRRGWLDQIGTGLGLLADGIDTYSDAFRTAKAKHPTPQEIIAARKELLAAMRSKNELGIQAALAKFNEQNARSMETITGYTTEVGSKVGAGEGTGEGNGNGKGNGSGGGDSSALSSMLPALMSAMASAGMPLAELGRSDSADDYSLEEYGYDDLGIPSGLGIGSPGGTPSSLGTSISDVTTETVAATALPLTAAASAGSSSMPRTPVIEPLSASSAANTAARGGTPMMPYMPMAPGMGNAGGSGNERNRVVAWHPDRLMYVDDTPHTEAVIGERPTIAPTVTSPTPAPTNQTPSQPGGNA